MNPKTSQDLFNKIRSQFSNIKIGDENGGATADPSEAVFFEFEFKEDADTFGSVSVSIADGENMKVFYNRDLVDRIDEDSKDEWYAFLKELKDFAVEHSLTFDVRDITKSNLTKQDYENLADTSKTVNTDEMSEELARITKLAGVYEGLTGTAKRSYENLDKTRLIIRHSGSVDETVPGARSRQIESLYIENEDGERFKYPLTHLAGARAMTRHVANGGRPHDEFGEHIIKTSEDIAKLNSFSRYVANKDQLNDNAGDIIEQTKLTLENLRSYVKNLSKQSHYETASKDFKTADEVVLDDETANSYKDKFTMKNFDSRVEEALPLIHKIMSELEVEKQEEPVAELDPGDEPIDAEPEKYVDHGEVVAKFLADPDSKILLNKNMPDEKILAPKNKGPIDTKIATVLSDIASRMLTKTPDEDRVANFASRVADQLTQASGPFPTKNMIDGPGFSKRNRDIAKALVAKYEKAAQEIDPKDFMPKKDIKGKAKETAEFESWVDEVIEGKAEVEEATIKPYISMYKGDDGKQIYDVLDKDSKSAFKTGDYEEAQKYFKDNFDKLKEYVKEPKDEKDREEKLKALQAIQMDPNTAKDPETVKAMIQRKKELMKQPAMAGEGNEFALAVQKAKAAGMKAGDKFKVGDKEYTLKDAIEIAGLDLNEFYSEEEIATEQEIARLKTLSIYQ